MSATATVTVSQPGSGNYKEPFVSGPLAFSLENERKGTVDQPAASHQDYLPTWKPEEKYGKLEPFTHLEHGKDADPTFPDLLTDGATVVDLTANIGAEVSGVQLHRLSDKGKDQLALFVAQKKVVAFRNQGFADLDIKDALEYGRYFGRLHIHPTSGSPDGYPEIHVVHRAAGDQSAKSFFASRLSSVTWHADVTYENQPPGTTFLYILDSPDAGGDTLFSNQVEAYNRLSPEFQKRLHGLKAVHSGLCTLSPHGFANLSGHEQAQASRNNGGVVRREPVTSVHPLVRTHPATGEKALYVNPQFTRHIVGYKLEESNNLLKFLYDHIAVGADFQARVKWQKGTVVVWDNRVTAHSVIIDWKNGQRRHLARITPQAEEPYETPFDG
ncbi:hypothetical protein MMC24_001776 [Lignoscripta atroalba]|nr:hypothetical protein [Lignoscripta atroalba]